MAEREYLAKIHPIETFRFPTDPFDYDNPFYLFYDEKLGWLVGRCIRTDLHEENPIYDFYFDREGLTANEVTHWMELPPIPEPEELYERTKASD